MHHDDASMHRHAPFHCIIVFVFQNPDLCTRYRLGCPWDGKQNRCSKNQNQLGLIRNFSPVACLLYSAIAVGFNASSSDISLL